MAIETLRRVHGDYLHCLNRQAWDELGQFVDENVRHDERPFGLAGYRNMLLDDFKTVPDLHFQATKIVCEPPLLMARLEFRASPIGSFVGLPVNGREISFTE